MSKKADIPIKGTLKHCVKCQISGFVNEIMFICPNCGETLE